MAERKVKSSVWTNPWVQNLEPMEKLVWAYLLTCESLSPSGIFQVTPKTIADDLSGEKTTISRSEISAILEKMQTDGHILYIDYYIALRDYHQHNNCIANPKYQTYIRKHLASLPQSIANELIQFTIPQDAIGNLLAIDRQSIGNPLARHSNKNKNKNKDKNKDKDKDKDKGKGKDKGETPTAPPLVKEVVPRRTVHLVNSGAVRDDGRSEWATGVWLSDAEWKTLSGIDEALAWDAIALAEEQFVKDKKEKNGGYVKSILKRLQGEKQNGKHYRS
jgi:hypothetical protein